MENVLPKHPMSRALLEAFKALVDGQNLEHQLGQLGGTTPNYLDIHWVPK